MGHKAYSRDAVVSINASDGWYKVDIFKRQIVSSCSQIELIQMKSDLTTYYLDRTLIPANFDICKRRLGTTVIEGVHLMQGMDNLKAVHIKFVRGQCFYLRSAPAPVPLTLTRIDIDNSKPLERKSGMTPEMIYVAGAYAMKVAEENAKLENLSLTERVHKVLSIAGARVIELIEHPGELFDLVWEMLGERFKSTIYKRSLQVFNLGICVSGGDKKHSLASAPLITKHAIEEDAVYRTQEVD